MIRIETKYGPLNLTFNGPLNDGLQHAAVFTIDDEEPVINGIAYRGASWLECYEDGWDIIHNRTYDGKVGTWRNYDEANRWSRPGEWAKKITPNAWPKLADAIAEAVTTYAQAHPEDVLRAEITYRYGIIERECEKRNKAREEVENSTVAIQEQEIAIDIVSKRLNTLPGMVTNVSHE